MNSNWLILLGSNNEALRFFSEKGYSDVYVGDIAEAVGIKAPSLYKHFKGKQEIFDSCVEKFYERMTQVRNNLMLPETPKAHITYEVVEDYGIRYMTYGNASGYSYSNAYRSFVVDIDGSIEFISLGVNAYSDNRTIICVAIDRDDGSPHHALQLAVDSFIVLDGQKCSFWHNGRIAVGRSGSGKAADLKKLLKQYAQHLMVNDEIRLGGFAYTANVFIDEPQMVQFVSNLINYSIVRDKYRNALSS